MKIHSVVILVGLAISFALTTFAQQKDTGGPRIVQQRDLLGGSQGADEFNELHEALDEAYKKNAAAAVAALFTKGALLVGPDGVFSGRQDIERMNAIDNAVWAAGQWKSLSKSHTGSVFAVGYWSAIYVHEGDAWKIRMLTLNELAPPK